MFIIVSLRVLLIFTMCFGRGLHMEVIRAESGDVFTNPDEDCISDACRSYRGRKINGIFNGRCKCACSGERSTFVLKDGVCADRKFMEMKLIKAECYYRLGKSCHSSKIPLIDTNRKGFKIISKCAFPRKDALDGSHIQCTVDTDHSYYYDEGIWWLLPSDQNIFWVEVSNTRSLYLKWNKGLDKRFQGRIISLALNCGLVRQLDVVHLTSSAFVMADSPTVQKSCLTFKTRGRVSVSILNKTTDPLPTEAITETPVQTSSSEDGTFLGANSTVNSVEGNEQAKSNIGVVVAVTVVSLLGMTLVISASILVIYRRKKRNENSSRDFVRNPSYEKSPDLDLKICSPVDQGKPAQYPTLTKQPSVYQPLVQNTRPRCLTAPNLYHCLNNEKCNACAAYGNSVYASLNKHTMDQYGLETTGISRVSPKRDRASAYHDYQEIEEVMYEKPGFYLHSKRRHSTYDNVPRSLEPEIYRRSVVAYAVAEPRMHLHSPRENKDSDHLRVWHEKPLNSPYLEEDYYEFLSDAKSPKYWVLSPGIKSPALVFEKNEIAI